MTDPYKSFIIYIFIEKMTIHIINPQITSHILFHFWWCMYVVCVNAWCVCLHLCAMHKYRSQNNIL